VPRPLINRGKYLEKIKSLKKKRVYKNSKELKGPLARPDETPGPSLIHHGKCGNIILNDQEFGTTNYVRLVTGTSSPERAREETGGADQWVLKRRELPGFAIVNAKKHLHPWDTHYQFSIKTILSKRRSVPSAGIHIFSPKTQPKTATIDTTGYLRLGPK